MRFPVAYKDLFLRRLLSLCSLLFSLLQPLSSFLRSSPFSALRDHLPVMCFSDAAASLESAAPETCVVCLCDFQEWEEVRWLGNCRHLFHRDCLDRWIDLDHRSCPLCRTHLLGDDLLEEFNLRLDQHYYFHDYDEDDGA